MNLYALMAHDNHQSTREIQRVIFAMRCMDTVCIIHNSVEGVGVRFNIARSCFFLFFLHAQSLGQREEDLGDSHDPLSSW
jgi:hypothetical protein